MDNPKSVRPIAIIGARGTLGKAFARLCDLRGIQYHLLTRQEMDITDSVSVDTALTQLNPWAVVNAAGYVRVDDAERDVDTCLRVNAQGPAILAASCARQGIPLLTFSSDLVFDGTCTTSLFNAFRCTTDFFEWFDEPLKVVPSRHDDVFGQQLEVLASFLGL